MNVDNYIKAIRLARKANIPLMAWGPGGVGKSVGARQAAIEENIGFYPIHAPVKLPLDVAGIPFEIDLSNPNSDRWNSYTKPVDFPVESAPIVIPDPSKPSIVLVDELPDSVPTMTKLYYSLILDRKVGVHSLGKLAYIMGAGNRAEDKGFSSPMPAPLITRFVHVGVCCPTPNFEKETVETAEIDVEPTLVYFTKHFHPIVASFLKLWPKYIYNHQAVPRTWEYISKLSYVSDDLTNYIYCSLVEGLVGVGIGQEFCAFALLYNEMPSTDAIIKNPDTALIPDKMDVAWATATALMHRLTVENASNIIRYIERLDMEIQYYFFMIAPRVNEKIIATKEYIAWSNRN